VRVLIAPRFLQVQDSTIWWTNTCPWHGEISTLQIRSSTMFGACHIQYHDAIYSQSDAPGSWWSNDTVTTWCWDLQSWARLKAMTLFLWLVTSFVASALTMPEPRCRGHMATVTLLDQWAACHFLGGKGISDHCWPVILQSTLHDKKLTLCQMAQCPNSAPFWRTTSQPSSTTWCLLFAPARLCVLVHPLWLYT
jgi:hypothetical protein